MNEKPKITTDIPIVARFESEAVTDPAVLGPARPRGGLPMNGTPLPSTLTTAELNALIAEYEQKLVELKHALQARQESQPGQD